MNVFIDLHAVANVLAFAFIVALCVLWALYSRRFVGFLVVAGLSLTAIIAAHSNLSVLALEGIALVGAVVTGAIALAFALIRANLRGRSRMRRPGRTARALYIAEKNVSSQPARSPRPRPSSLPAPEPEARAYEEYETEEYETEPVYAVRQPVRYHSGARPRSGSARPAGRNSARGARLQGGR